MELTSKVAIITGAAQGIGEAAAVHLASLGAKVLVVDFNEAGACKVVEGLRKAGAAADAFRADVTQPAEVEQFVAHAMKTWGRIDILVNNASNVSQIGAADGDVVTTDMEVWDQAFAANLRGPASACRSAIPHMIAQGGGTIVNIASIQGVTGDLTRVAYSASKAD